jgi:hypothetical protein
VSMGAATVAAVRCEGCMIKLPLDEANPFEELPKRYRPGDQEADAAAVNGGDASKNGGGAKLAVLEEGEREVLMKRIAALQEGELVLKEQLHASQQLIGKLKVYAHAYERETVYSCLTVLSSSFSPALAHPPPALSPPFLLLCPRFFSSPPLLLSSSPLLYLHLYFLQPANSSKTRA